jgi:hypothetical protein
VSTSFFCNSSSKFCWVRELINTISDTLAFSLPALPRIVLMCSVCRLPASLSFSAYDSFPWAMRWASRNSRALTRLEAT